MSGPDPRDDDETMDGDDDVSRAYRRAATEASPREVDQAVLGLAREDERLQRAAREAPRAQRLLQDRRWRWPFAVAATMVLAFSALLALRDDPSSRAALEEAAVRAGPVPAADAPPAVQERRVEAGSADPARSRSRTDHAQAPAVAAAPAPAPSMWYEQTEALADGADAMQPTSSAQPGSVAERGDDTETNDAAERSYATEPSDAAERSYATEPGDAAGRSYAREPGHAAEPDDAAEAHDVPEPLPPPAGRALPERAERQAPAPERAPAAGVWQPQPPLRKSVAPEPVPACPPDVPDCATWRSAQRSLDTVFSRDEARRARCYTATCPGGSTISAAELAEVAPAFTGESTRARLRGRWQTDYVTYAFSDRYVLQRRREDDGSVAIFLRRARYRPIGQGIEVLEEPPTDEGPVVILRANLESSRVLRLLDAQGEPRGALAPGVLPLAQWRD